MSMATVYNEDYGAFNAIDVSSCHQLDYVLGSEIWLYI